MEHDRKGHGIFINAAENALQPGNGLIIKRICGKIVAAECLKSDDSSIGQNLGSLVQDAPVIGRGVPGGRRIL